MEPLTTTVSFLEAPEAPTSTGAGFFDFLSSYVETAGETVQTGIETVGETAQTWFGEAGDTLRTPFEEAGETTRTAAEAWSPAPVLIGLGVGGIALYLLTRK